VNGCSASIGEEMKKGVKIEEVMEAGEEERTSLS